MKPAHEAGSDPSDADRLIAIAQGDKELRDGLLGEEAEMGFPRPLSEEELSALCRALIRKAVQNQSVTVTLGSQFQRAADVQAVLGKTVTDAEANRFIAPLMIMMTSRVQTIRNTLRRMSSETADS